MQAHVLLCKSRDAFECLCVSVHTHVLMCVSICLRGGREQWGAGKDAFLLG